MGQCYTGSMRDRKRAAQADTPWHQRVEGAERAWLASACIGRGTACACRGARVNECLGSIRKEKGVGGGGLDAGARGGPNLAVVFVAAGQVGALLTAALLLQTNGALRGGPRRGGSHAAPAAVDAAKALHSTNHTRMHTHAHAHKYTPGHSSSRLQHRLAPAHEYAHARTHARTRVCRRNPRRRGLSHKRSA